MQMNTITITQDNQAGKTSVSNYFIDEYMKDANDAQIKIYLYLLRVSGTSLPAGITDIADRFNHTEHDVLRALKYWDKLHVISLLYDDNKKLAGIRLENLETNSYSDSDQDLAQSEQSVDSVIRSAAKPAPAAENSSLAKSSSDSADTRLNADQESAGEAPEFDKTTISLDQLRDFKNREDTPQLLFIIEQYLGKTLSSNDIRSIYFMTDVLHLSPDLIDYLIQYCVGRSAKDFHYIEKVGRSWAEAGIVTPKQAASYIRKYDKNVYAIMREFGKSTDPAPKELVFIYRWLKEYTFSTDVILEACGRAVLATDKRRFEYAEGILSKWHAEGIHSLSDVTSADSARPKRAVSSEKPASTNQFNQFRQNQYDYDDLLNKIKVN